MTVCLQSNKVWDRDVEERQGIISAIEQGDLAGVKKLVTPQNVNSSLMKKQLFVIRTTTPLSYTATRGNLDIIKHLVGCKTFCSKSDLICDAIDVTNDLSKQVGNSPC